MNFNEIQLSFMIITTGTLTFSIKSQCDPYNSGTRRFRMSKFINNIPTIIFTASVTAHYERTDSITINVGETLDILLYYYSLGGVWSSNMSATIMSCTASSGQAVTIGTYPTFYVSAYYVV